MLISEIDKIYNTKPINIELEEVESKALWNFSKSINSFKLEIDLNYSDYNILEETHYFFRKISNKFITNFFNYDLILSEEEKNLLKKYLEEIKNSFNTLYKDKVLDILTSLKELMSLKSNFMTEKVISVIADNFKNSTKIKLAFVTKRAIRFDEKMIFEKYLMSFKKMHFFTENGFRSDEKFYDCVVYIGSPKYFSEYTINTLKSKKVIFIAYNFFDNRFVYSEPLKKINQKNTLSTVYDEVYFKKSKKQQQHFLMPEPLTSKKMLEKFLNSTKEDSQIDKTDLSEIITTYFENDRCMFIPTNAKVKTLSWDGKVNYTAVNDLEEDTFIIIRNKSDSKLIGEIADEFYLKEKTLEYRNLQSEWKSKLKKLILDHGLKDATKLLKKEFKINSSSVSSIKNWIKEESIQPRELEDILRALDYKGIEIKRILTVTSEIMNAHRQSGRLISEKLMKEISPAVINELKEKGYHTFNSKEFSDVTFNIERIIYIERDIKYVSSSNTMKVHNLL